VKSPEVWENNFYASRLSFLHTYRNAAKTLAFVYQVTGERKYADKVYEFADAICEVDNWVNGFSLRPERHPVMEASGLPTSNISLDILRFT
jgi:hypothetical protein